MYNKISILFFIYFKILYCSFFSNVFIETSFCKPYIAELALCKGAQICYCIEPNQHNFFKAYNLYKSCPNIHLLLSESKKILKPLISTIDEPFTIYFNNSSTLLENLETVFSHHIKVHTLFFNTINTTIKERILQFNPKYQITTLETYDQDIIYIAFCEKEYS